jgi:hypothetical protein
MKLVDPKDRDSPAPALLWLKAHTDAYRELRATAWLETYTQSGNYIPEGVVALKRDEIASQAPTLPRVKVMQGSQRIHAMQPTVHHAHALRTEMVRAGRAGDKATHDNCRTELEELMRKSTFLVAVYPCE